MRIHLQNPIDDPLFHFSQTMWDAAAGPETHHAVSIGSTAADLAAAMEEAEALVRSKSVV